MRELATICLMLAAILFAASAVSWIVRRNIFGGK